MVYVHYERWLFGGQVASGLHNCGVSDSFVTMIVLHEYIRIRHNITLPYSRVGSISEISFIDGINSYWYG